MTQYKFINSDAEVPGEGGSIPPFFSITTPPSTDVWEKPPSTSRFSAPILYQSMPLESFRRARVAINAQWKHLYDQGGLILVLRKSDGSQKWVKAGVEITHGKPHLGVVAKDRWADWSLLPVPSGGGAATIEMVREADESLWIYLVEGVQKAPIREVTWLFKEADVTELWVGTYAARPGQEGGDLSVEFGHFNVETA
ncbi:hypothetical protein POX_c04707 [Penicillium oxalicum]|uniref:Beta-xylosidase C-terminal Concanavalin A-like domain-containing protein n=1 Tax=Penicillium oxalicum (strain 114-2 / CGMCC 5302) TaxID=933388 RepID=S8AWI4_PENO1|nr:hypothetical protein POX_c04707 [Penicillium oxalicum]EPS26242.1 hypothetical protein PDE_01178 [Penicillium oxalicum 114-2]KAI2791828.1 hypothetical protein POX_c04707 [Penicillium oxalicum]